MNSRQSRALHETIVREERTREAWYQANQHLLQQNGIKQDTSIKGFGSSFGSSGTKQQIPDNSWIGAGSTQQFSQSINNNNSNDPHRVCQTCCHCASAHHHQDNGSQHQHADEEQKENINTNAQQQKASADTKAATKKLTLPKKYPFLQKSPAKAMLAIEPFVVADTAMTLEEQTTKYNKILSTLGIKVKEQDSAQPIRASVGKGLIISKVEGQKLGEVSGLRTNDIITYCNHRVTRNISEFKSALLNEKINSNKVHLKVQRGAVKLSFVIQK